MTGGVPASGHADDDGQASAPSSIGRLTPRAGEARGEWVRRLRHQALPYLQGETLMISLAVAVGLITGLLASALIGAIALVQRVTFGSEVSWPLLLVVPTLPPIRTIGPSRPPDAPVPNAMPDAAIPPVGTLDRKRPPCMAMALITRITPLPLLSGAT